MLLYKKRARTRPGERPPARGTARTVPRFSSMTPPSMHSSSLHILCICGTGCTSECQKDRLQHARLTTHTARRAAASEVDSAHRPTLLLHDSAHDTCGPTALPLPRQRLCLGRASALFCFVESQSSLRVLTSKTLPLWYLVPLAHQERLPEKQKEAKRSKSARFKNAKEAKVLALRNRLRKSGRRACKKCSTQRTRTDRKYCHTELMVPRSSGPPEYFRSLIRL